MMCLLCFVQDSPDCACGFMSTERMRLLLGLETVGNMVLSLNQRQQITPSMKFLCDGLVTKWIIAGNVGLQVNHNLHPELQIWRKTGNETFERINGTFVVFQNRSERGIYEYEDFSPIPVLSGDILGIFQPERRLSRLRIHSEEASEPTNYYHTTADGPNGGESPFNTIHLQNASRESYHPLISVEMSKLTSFCLLYSH